MESILDSAEEVFELHPKIRWAAKTSERGEVKFCKMRSGVSSLTPEGKDEFFMQTGALVLLGVCEKMVSWHGSVDSLVISYDRVVMYIRRLGNEILAMTLDKHDNLGSTMHEIGTRINQLL